MSRLIIKGLPSRYDDKNLRQLFSFAGEVTDAKVIKTKDGRSRQFGFIGFRNGQEAKKARHQLNNSYVDTQRVSVDFAHAVGANTIPRPWSKYSEGSSLHKKNNADDDVSIRKAFLKKEAERNRRIRELKAKQREDGVKDGDIAALREFQESAGKRGSNPLWADGGIRALEKSTLVASRKTGGEGTFLERKHVKFDVPDSDDEDDGLYEDLPDSSALNEEKADGDGDATEKGDGLALDEGISDMDYFKSKVVAQNEGEDKASESQKSVSVEAADTELQEHNENRAPETSQESDESDEEQQAGKSSENAAEKRTQNANENRLESKFPSRDGNAERKADASETGRLLVRNLAYSMTDEELEMLFEPFGTLADVHVVRDRQSGKSRGMAFVQYVTAENAPQALLSVDGTFHSGRILHVLPAQPRPALLDNYSATSGTTKAGNSKFKEGREESLKDSARKGLDAHAQHALHLSSDAVAQVMADRHSVSKADLFGTSRGESGVAAVRLAMAEATVQGETKQFLLENGVNLGLLQQMNEDLHATTAAARRKRQSRTAFLVKNLPARTHERQLEGTFSRFGKLKRLVVVPSGTLAVVEYGISSNAKKAYNSLAYTKFQDAPLYLEWLPAQALTPVHDDNKLDKSSTLAENEPENKDPTSVAEGVSTTPENVEAKTGSVYVKNLNFETRDAALKEHFQKVLRKRPKVVASLRSATVALRRKNEGKASERLSMGFGFLEFSSRAHAIEAVKNAQNTTLDGHTLQLRLSNKDDEDRSQGAKRKRVSSKGKKPGPKLIVRNVAFEATRSDIRQLFSAFGQLKTVRIPRKIDGSHRGFAFVEFVSKNEAKTAYEALSASHLYGRHLVIEYAEDTGTGFASIAEMQARAATQIARKRTRMSDGSNVAASGGEEPSDELVDEQAMLEDELYA
ncbi:unnamed protein product [Chondrus crispus]|uniref:RRM domain-containing protein n=1 Tax=Chondrus crispus TaxID=2769 RepID=R7QIL2_CHOCR|nr:unnamed protein product [Chondrus crispus]CDF37909.1 unnamed protein product [Chondrus crispus]|eukprot:XP_005717780.1 unnamed protein product [Chondrus crispus]